jgi:nucleotide-binding universal stress UspA family protein
MPENSPKILVGFDGSANSIEALAWAVDEASTWGWAVEALSVLQVPALAYGAPGYMPPTLERYRDEMAQVVEEALASTGRAGAGCPPVTLRVADGTAPSSISERAGDDDVMMVVVGARGHGVITELMLGSASHALSHTCPKPLVIVPHGWSRSRGERRPPAGL